LRVVQNIVNTQIIAEDIKHIQDEFHFWEEFKDKTILITGASGMLASYLVDTFLNMSEQLNLSVICLVRDWERARLRFPRYLNNVRFKLICQDISLPIRIDSNIHFIIHAASNASPRTFINYPVDTINANVLGTINLLNLAREKKVNSFLFFSSSEVYGQLLSNDVAINEELFGSINPLKIRSCYSESKKMGENICLSYFAQYGVKTKVVRPFHTYGPGFKLDDGRVFADFISDYINHQKIIVKSNGRDRRSFCYITDATLGFLTVLLKGKCGEAYNIGNPAAEKSIIELARLVSQLRSCTECKVEYENNSTFNHPNEISRFLPDISKAIQLGWNPTTTVEIGFERTLRSFLNE
jgi:UDP-glucuronate decarboxylase